MGILDAPGYSRTQVKQNYGTPAYNLLAAGLNGSTTDIKAMLDGAVAFGAKRIVIPTGTWPLATKWTCPDDIHVEFEPGAKINLTMLGAMPVESEAIVFGNRCRMTDSYFTSPYTGPASAADNYDSSGSLTYVYNARVIKLGDDCVVENHYQENCSAGIEFIGKRSKVIKARFKNIRQFTGWGSALHAAGGYASHNSGEDLYYEDCDRGTEIEDSSSCNTFTKGHALRVGPNGYTGQPVTYADYTFILDTHSHLSENACQGNHYEDWLLEDCRGGITAVRSSGTQDSDLPKNNTWHNITIAGRVGTTGYESVYLQGHGNKVTGLRFQAGSGVTSMMRAVFAGGSGSGNVVEFDEVAAYALPLVSVGSDANGKNNSVAVKKVSAPTTGTGVLLDIYHQRTKVILDVDAVLGTTGYVELHSTAKHSKVGGFYQVHGTETYAQAILVSGAPNVRVSDLNGVNTLSAIPDIATSGGVVGLLIDDINIERVNGGNSISLGGASSYCVVGRNVDLGTGKVNDAGTNNSVLLRSGDLDYISTLGNDPALAGVVLAGGSVNLPTANQAVVVRMKATRKLSLARVRWLVGTQSGNYDIAVLDHAGTSLWSKGSTTVPAGGSLVDLSFTAITIQRGQVFYVAIVFDNTTATMKGITLASGDPLRSLAGTLTATYVASSFPLPTVGNSLAVGTTASLRLPLVTVHEA